MHAYILAFEDNGRPTPSSELTAFHLGITAGRHEKPFVLHVDVAIGCSLPVRPVGLSVAAAGCTPLSVL